MSRRRVIVLTLSVPLALALLTTLFLAWVAATGSGLRFAARVAERAASPGLRIESPSGTLLGPLQIDRITYDTPEQQVAADDVRLEWRPSRLLDGLFFADRLSIGRLWLLTRSTEDKPPEKPESLALPLRLRMDQFHVGEIVMGSPTASEPAPAPLVTEVNGRFASDGRRHRLDRLTFGASRLAVEASGELGGLPPFPVSARGRISGNESGHPFEVELDAAGSLSALTVEARSASGELTVNGSAELDLFAPQPLRHGSVTAVGLDPAAWVESAPHAQLSLDARIAPVRDEPEAVSAEIAVANGQPGPPSEGRIPLRRLDATIHIGGSAIQAPSFTVSLMHGEITGSALWSDETLTLTARASEVDASTWHPKLSRTSLSGPLRARVSAAFQQVEAELTGPRFRVQLDASCSNGEIRIATARLASRGASLEASGKIDPQGGTFDVEGRLQNFDPSLFAEVPKGRLNATLDAKGQFGDRPAVDLQFALRDSRLAGRPLAGSGDVVLTPDVLQRANVVLRAGDNRVEARGALGAPGDVLNVAIAAPRLDQVGLSGALSGRATLFGPLRAPGAEWTLESPRLALPDGPRLMNAVTRGRLEPEASSIHAEVTVGTLDPGGGAPVLKGLSAIVDGARSRHRIEAKTRAIGDGEGFELAATGGLDRSGMWTGQLGTLEWRGPHPFRLAAPTRLEVSSRLVTAGRAQFVGEEWRATLDGLSWQPGRLRTSGAFTGLPAAAFLPSQVAARSSSLRLGGEWNIDLGANASGRARLFREAGDLAVPADNALALGLERLALTADFAGNRVDIAVDGYGTRAGLLEGRVSVGLHRENGLWSLAQHDSWRGRLQFDTPSIAWLSPLAGETVTLGGHLRGTVTIGGTPSTPAFDGEVLGSGLRVRLLDHGLDLSGGTLRLEFTPDVVRLRRLEMIAPATQRPDHELIDFRRLAADPGRLTAEGELDLDTGAGSIRLQADQLAFSQLQDRWVMVSGTSGLRFTEGHIAVSGDLTVDAAYVELPSGGRPTLSPDVVVVGREQDSSPAQPVSLDLTLNLGDAFYFRGAGIESRLAGQIRLEAERRDRLRAVGTVRTVSGTFDAYGRELSIERGILNFQGLLDNPGLNVRALRKNLPVEAGVEVDGTLKEPRIRLVSEPSVPDTEKLSWMILGRPPGEGIGAGDADLLLSAAMALRGGGQGKGPLRSLAQGLGLEELGISAGTLDERSRFPASHVAGSFAPRGGAASAAEQIATIGKRISSNAVLSYERSIASAESILKLTVELSRRLSLVGRVGDDSSIGILYSFAFGGRDREAPPGKASR